MFLFIFISVGQDFSLAYFSRKREFDILCAGNRSNENPGGGGGGGGEGDSDEFGILPSKIEVSLYFTATGTGKQK